MNKGRVRLLAKLMTLPFLFGGFFSFLRILLIIKDRYFIGVCLIHFKTLF